MREGEPRLVEDRGDPVRGERAVDGADVGRTVREVPVVVVGRDHLGVHREDVRGPPERLVEERVGDRVALHIAELAHERAP